MTDMERPKIEAHLAEVYTAALGIRTTDLAVLAEGVWRNLESLCRVCHEAEHGRDRRHRCHK